MKVPGTLTRPCGIAVVALLSVSLPASAFGCEPILPLFQLLSGSSLAGAGILTHSLVWLAAAVGIKCGAFALLERRLSWPRAVAYMLAANIVSTIPGLLIAAFTASSGVGVILAILIVIVLSWMLQRRLSKLPRREGFKWVTGGIGTIAFAACIISSMIMYALAQSALEDRSF